MGKKSAGQFLQFVGGTLTVQGAITADSIAVPSAATTPSSSITSDGLLTTVSASIGGWDIDSTTLASKDDKVIIDSSNKRLTINNTTFGDSGIQLDYNSGTPRFYVGNGSNRAFIFDGTNVHVSGSNLTVDGANSIVKVGDASNEHVEVTTAGVKLKDSSTVLGLFTAGGATLGKTTEPHISASTSDIFIYGNDTTDYLKLSAGEVSMYSNSDRKVAITDDGINIGPASVGPSSAGSPSAVVGNISLHSAGAHIYGAATDDYVNVKSDGVDVFTAGTQQATFGATTKIGDPSNDWVEIDSSGIDIYRNSVSKFNVTDSALKLLYDSNNYAQLDSDSLDIVLGGQTSASFGTTTTIGPTGGNHIEVTGTALSIKNASTTFLSASSAGLYTSGHIHASHGTIGGFTQQYTSDRLYIFTKLANISISCSG